MRRAGVRNWTSELSTAAAASVLFWISRTLLSLLAAYPLLLAIQATGMVSGPEGDAVLFRPGSLLLLELLRVGGASLGAGLKLSLLLAAIASVAGLVPLAFALDLLSADDSRFSARVGRALGLFPKFLGLGAIGLLAQAALLLASSLLGAALKALLQHQDERLLSLLPLLTLGLGLLLCGWFGCVIDVARAALVQEELSAREALARALSCLRSQPYRLLVGAYPSVAGAALAYTCALWVMTRLDLSGPSNVAIALAFGAHQLAVLFAIGWRVRWLDTALELSAESR